VKGVWSVMPFHRGIGNRTLGGMQCDFFQFRVIIYWSADGCEVFSGLDSDHVKVGGHCGLEGDDKRVGMLRARGSSQSGFIYPSHDVVV